MRNDVNDSRTNGHESTEGVPFLPCPFCGSADIMEGFYYAEGKAEKRGAVRCADCGVRAPTSSWNRRSRWRSMETFPKDGECYLATDNRVAGGFPQVVYFDDATGRFHVSDAGISYLPGFFTHWTHVPETTP